MTEGYDGEVTATVAGPGGSAEAPVLTGGVQTLTVPLKKGQATLQVKGGCCFGLVGGWKSSVGSMVGLLSCVMQGHGFE